MKWQEKYKGIHPGLVLERELKKRGIKLRPFALLVNEYPQTFNAITKGKRRINTALALKIERQLGLDEGDIVVLQAYHDIEKLKNPARVSAPDLSVLNKALFWDTRLEMIDWKGQYKAVIKRVFERGNETAKAEITRYYGARKVKTVLKESDKQKPYTVYGLT
jgi:plasmid maintenance system antidote protein VapI